MRSQIVSSPASSLPANATTTAPPSTSGATPERLRIRLTLRLPNTPGSTSSASAGNASIISPNNAAITPLTDNTTVSPPIPEACNAAPLPSAHQGNLRLERAKEALEGKRKSNGKTPSTAPKRQKISALAKPTKPNTVRYISISILVSFSYAISRNFCMRQWNERQPNGQGLASDFNTYFDGLSDVEIEVRRLYSHLGCTLLTSTPSKSC